MNSRHSGRGVAARIRTGVCAVTALGIVAALGAGGVAHAQSGPAEPTPFETVDGHQLVLYPIGSLTCSDMRALLREIDRTDYRGRNPGPIHDGDMPLFRYENDLATAHYEACVDHGVGSPAPRFKFIGTN